MSLISRQSSSKQSILHKKDWSGTHCEFRLALCWAQGDPEPLREENHSYTSRRIRPPQKIPRKTVAQLESDLKGMQSPPSCHTFPNVPWRLF